ncbi:FIST N-terminal domain-containing protein [Vibrio lentus]|uniref:FIST domain-containing protein n=1 Tax=Vibrio lentus TaxID=136468 RepID=A0A2N7KJM5_9VIBR|nr:FIST N-terminal domain-containing protein [Vibrio lentus]PMM76310.1 hypothetical protein BCT49_22605 [Vibrio lentus]
MFQTFFPKFKQNKIENQILPSKIYSCEPNSLPTFAEIKKDIQNPSLCLAYVAHTTDTTLVDRVCKSLQLLFSGTNCTQVSIMSSGNLLSEARNVYQAGSVVLHIFDKTLIAEVEPCIVDLPKHTKPEDIDAHINKMRVSISSHRWKLQQNHFNTFCYVTFDGHSMLEGQLLSAAYASGNIDVPIIGGSAGGVLFSRAAWGINGQMHDGKALMLMTQIGDAYSYAFRSTHSVTGSSNIKMTVAKCDNSTRTLQKVVDERGEIKSTLSTLQTKWGALF